MIRDRVGACSRKFGSSSPRGMARNADKIGACVLLHLNVHTATDEDVWDVQVRCFFAPIAARCSTCLRTASSRSPASSAGTLNLRVVSVLVLADALT